MFKHILIPTDGSEFASAAVTKCVELARELKARVTVVYVTPPWTAAVPGEMAIAIPVEEYEKGLAEHAKQVLADAKALFDESGVSCTTLHVRDRYPAEGIVDAANSRGCDLIAMASHGRRGLSKLLLGSQATEVLSAAHIPVLILRS